MRGKVAVIGAGYAGLATAWHLLHEGFAVDVYDPVPLGTGTSGIAAGLLHTYMGPDAKPAWSGTEAYASTLSLLQIASTALDHPVFSPSGILRVALTERQCDSFHERSQLHDDVTWLEAEETAKRVPGIVTAPSIFIQTGISVDGNAYLRGLWKACQQQGAQLVSRLITDLADLSHYHAVVIASGANTKTFAEIAHLPVHAVKGQLLEVRWPASLPRLLFPVNSHVYCLMHPHRDTCFIGGTYERGFATTEPDIEVAKTELLPRAARLLPCLADAEVIDVRSGVRASTPGHLPIAEKVATGVWVLTGLGSKGLLYHAWLSQRIVQQIASNV